jgi:hypothetical protein
MLTLALLLAAIPPLDPARIHAGAMCYALLRNDVAIGATWQRVKPATVEGRPGWDVVVHQRVGNGAFDLRDHFLLRADLTPVAMDSRKSGTEHVRVAYAPGKAVTTRPGQAATETVLPGPIYDGNLWGITFGALRLQDGAHLTLPFYQYDKGLGIFTLDVKGSETVQTPGGPRAAWLVDASTDGKPPARYRIAKDDGTELGYSGGPVVSRLGGDCSGFPKD